MPSRHDIDNETLRRAVDEIQRKQAPSGEYPAGLPCKDHESRIQRLEETQTKHANELSEGGKQFVRLEAGMATLAEKVSNLTTILAWVGGAIGLGLLGTAGTALLWAIAHMGAKA